jgi:sec-independent protein translocase protein TatB
MFDISWGELILIGMVALIVIGPKELPTVLRTMGQYMTKIRRMASEFQGQFNEALREAEMSDLKDQVDGIRDTAKGFNPLQTIRNEFDDAFKGAKMSNEDLTPSSTSTYGSASPTTADINVPMPEEPPPINPAEFAPAPSDTAPAATPASAPAAEPHPERAALDGAPATAAPTPAPDTPTKKTGSAG